MLKKLPIIQRKIGIEKKPGRGSTKKHPRNITKICTAVERSQKRVLKR